MICDIHEEVLEHHGCPGEEACQKSLAGLQAAGHAVLGSSAAAVGQAAVTEVLLCARDVDVPAAIHQQILPLTNASQPVGDEVLPLNGVPALVARPACSRPGEISLSPEWAGHGLEPGGDSDLSLPSPPA